MKVRTRIAPSPTGDPHIGTAYIALLNYLYARRHGGEFILRIEDTDALRSSRRSENLILLALRWLGLEWDEGPDVGGDLGPYRQSDRLPTYINYAKRLVAAGHAFYCFCSNARLSEVRQQQAAENRKIGYDGACLHLSPTEVSTRLRNAESHVIRIRVPSQGSCEFEDILRGKIVISWAEIDMQVVVKSDGYPTYHLASVVDDHLMDITHVIRGEEWLSSTPKQLLLYNYFDWEPPLLCHVPLLRNPDRSKLSKRKNPTGILFYKAMGFLPEALVNFLGLFALAVAEGDEIRTLQALTEEFELQRVPLGGPVFDVEKLSWLNARWIRERLDGPELTRRVLQWAHDLVSLPDLLELARPRIQKLMDLGDTLDFAFRAIPPETVDALLRTNLLPSELKGRVFDRVISGLDQLVEWTREDIQQVLRNTAAEEGIPFKQLLKLLYPPITGKMASLPLFDVIALLGRERCRERLRVATAVSKPC
jgi:glutamyl-tRNA synthetase